jgi:hypothetical protein
MTDEMTPDLSGEQEREQDAAAEGIATRTAVLEIDDDDATLQDGEAADADDGDDDAIEDDDEGEIDAGV